MASYRTAAATYAPQHMGFGSVGDFQNGANGATFGWNTPHYPGDLEQSRCILLPFMPAPAQNDVSNVSSSVIDDLAAIITGIGTVVANFIVSRTIATRTSGIGTVTPNVRVSRPLAVAVVGTSAVTPNLKVSRTLATVIAGVGAVTANLKVTRALSTVITGVGAVTAALTVNAGAGVSRLFATAVAGTSTVIATLAESRRLASSVVSTTSITASLKLQDSLRTITSGASQVIAAFTTSGTFIEGISDALKRRRRMLRQVGTITSRRRR